MRFCMYGVVRWYGRRHEDILASTVVGRNDWYTHTNGRVLVRHQKKTYYIYTMRTLYVQLHSQIDRQMMHQDILGLSNILGEYLPCKYVFLDESLDGFLRRSWCLVVGQLIFLNSLQFRWQAVLHLTTPVLLQLAAAIYTAKWSIDKVSEISHPYFNCFRECLDGVFLTNLLFESKRKSFVEVPTCQWKFLSSTMKKLWY